MTLRGPAVWGAEILIWLAIVTAAAGLARALAAAQRGSKARPPDDDHTCSIPTATTADLATEGVGPRPPSPEAKAGSPRDRESSNRLRTARAPRSSDLLAVTTGLLWVAVGRLAWGFVEGDWGLVEVALHARRDASLAYRLSGLWSGAAGSLLVWTTILSTVLWAVVAAQTTSGRAADRERARAWVSLVVLAHLVVLAVAAEPFARFELPPSNGAGLVPVLEHPAIVWHPPLLYLGLAAAMAPWISGLAAAPARTVQRRRHLALLFLTLGLATGARWAYVELGWGGWWAWDPVENAALGPWLLLIAALHRDHRTPRSARDAWLACLVLAGVAVTRSGSAVSVHAFADGGRVGVGIGLVAGVVACHAAVRSFRLAGANAPAGASTARRLAGALSAGGAIGVAATVLLPAFAVVAGRTPFAIDGSFPARLLGTIALVASGAILTTTIGRIGRLWAVSGALFALAVVLATTPGRPGLSGLAIGACGGSVAAAAVSGRWSWPSRLGHLGVGIFLIGVAGSLGEFSERHVIAPGAPVVLAGRTVAVEDVRLSDGDGRRSVIADITVGDARVTTERGIEVARSIGFAETGTHSDLTGDVQAALLGGDADRILVRLDIRALTWAVWVGAGFISAAGFAGALTSTSSSGGPRVRTAGQLSDRR